MNILLIHKVHATNCEFNTGLLNKKISDYREIFIPTKYFVKEKNLTLSFQYYAGVEEPDFLSASLKTVF